VVPEPPRSRKGIWVALGALAVVLLVGGTLLVTVFHHASVALPDQIDGVPRITNQVLSGAANGIVKQAGLNGHKSVAGFYGANQQPEFLMLATEASEPPSSDRQALEAMAGATAGSSTLSVDVSSITTEQRDGVTYDCAPVSGAQVSGAACVWNDGDTIGVVVWFTDRGTPVDFASDVHGAVVS
jgi:hypothetical protein